jgi:hypothetical protein
MRILAVLLFAIFGCAAARCAEVHHSILTDEDLRTRAEVRKLAQLASEDGRTFTQDDIEFAIRQHFGYEKDDPRIYDVIVRLKLMDDDSRGAVAQDGSGTVFLSADSYGKRRNFVMAKAPPPAPAAAFNFYTLAMPYEKRLEIAKREYARDVGVSRSEFERKRADAQTARERK